MMTTTNNVNKDEQKGKMMTTDNDKQQRWRQPTMNTNMDNNEQCNSLVFDRIAS